MTDTPFIIFLVHGTFARGAAWTRPHSVFCKRLTRELRARGHDDIRIMVLDWSGGNGHRARREAAVRLERAMRQSVREHPDAHHYAVAHSHGGNIALRAVGRSGFFDGRRIGIVTLATPFLTFHKVQSSMITWPVLCAGFAKGMLEYVLLTVAFPLTMMFVGVIKFVQAPRLFVDPTRRRDALSTFAIVVVFSALLPVAYWLATLMYEHWGPTPGHWVSGLCKLTLSEAFCMPFASGFNLILLAVGALVLAGFGYLHALVEVSWSRRRGFVRLRRQIFRRYAYSQQEKGTRVPKLVMSSSVDEALGALSGVWVMHRWTEWLVRAVSVTVLLASVALAVILLSRLSDWVTAPGRNPFVTAVIWEQGSAAFMVIGAVIVAVFLGITTKLLGKLAGSSNIGLGLAKPDHNLLWSVRVQRRPGQGADAEVVRYRLREILDGSEGLLLHSRLYTHQRAIRHIAEWMHRQQNAWKAHGTAEPPRS